MRVLLTGAGGKVGRAWLRAASAAASGLDVTPFPPAHECDLGTAEGLARLTETVRGSDFELVVHAAAWTDVDGCERDPARAARTNSVATTALARACGERRCGLVFYSTDYVFAGGGPRGEEDRPQPLNVYGRSKAAAETSVREAAGIEALIVRINVPLAPPADGPSFYSFVRDGLRAGERVAVVTDQWNNPLDTDRIARWSLEAWRSGTRGTLHLAGGTYATRFDLARLIAAHLDCDAGLIAPVRTADLKQAARRPERGGLLTVTQARLFGTPPDLPHILAGLPA